MQTIPIDKLLDKTGSAYKLVIVAARRAIELSEGAAKLVDVAPDMKAGNVALKEILEGKITYKAQSESK